MNKDEKWSYLEAIRLRYHTSGRPKKQLILDEFCKVSGYHRKYAIRLLHQGSVVKPKKRRGRRPRYQNPEFLAVLKALWLATDMMCGKRLVKAIPLWLPHYEKGYGGVSTPTRSHLLAISSATIDRCLRPYRVSDKVRGLSGTRPGYLLKTQIPIKTNHWDVSEPGFLEADTVAHCGNSLQGDFVWSITCVDICTGWVEIRATWNKGAHGVVTQIKDIESCLPFNLKGFDCDNGSEFLNYHLLEYLQKRKRPIDFTRSRPYKKNDNAYVEQKNWTGVRHIFSYYRLDQEIFVELMNDIYKNEWRLLLNFFYPSMQLAEKVKVNSKYKRKYHAAMTPYQRIIKSTHVSAKKKKELKRIYKSLNPFELRERLDKKLKYLFSHVVNYTANPKRRV